MTKDERQAFRLALLAAPVDIPMSIEETCAFTGWSETTVIASTIPRGKEGGRVFFLKSQVQLWCRLRTPHLLEVA